VLNNNDIMKKLRIALHLKDTDIVEILKLAEFEITASELSAIFRKEDQDNYRPCGDQILRRFLDGLIIRNRGALAPKKEAPRKPAPEPWQKVAPWSKKGKQRERREP
jgi:hypothetical protein